MTETTVERTTDEDQTFALGRRLASTLEKGDVLGLIGPLGAGKTVFVKGLAGGLGMEDPRNTVTSPTYTLQDVYHLRETLYHCDAYRLEASTEFVNLGWTEQFATGITAIEWANRFFPELKPHLSMTLTFELDAPDDGRTITIRTE